MAGFSDHKTGVWIPQDEYGQRGLSIHMASSRAMHITRANAIYPALQNTDKVRRWYKNFSIHHPKMTYYLGILSFKCTHRSVLNHDR